MTQPQPGWFSDPSRTHQWRWWDGERWTDHVTPFDAPGAIEPSPVRPARPRARQIPLWGWVAMGVIGIAVAVALYPLIPLAALAVLITAIIALATATPTWLRLRSKKIAIGAVAASAAVLLVSGTVSAAVVAGGALRDRSREPVSFAAVSPSATISPHASPSPSPKKPSPTPSPTISTEIVTEAIAFAQTSIEDGGIPRGQTAVTTTGQPGQRTLTYAVTILGGKEISRELVSDVVTVAPIAEVTAVGTYDPPPPPPPPAAPAGPSCDPNYADACVPIASDVDCAGGSGNGPAYFDGVARVVGRDIYDLDRDGDGYACETW